MKSGLYACAGASATASAAACAKRFDDPITNRSNVYFGFIPPSREPPARGSTGRSGCTGTSAGKRSLTDRTTRRSWPVTSRTAAPIRPRKWPSIHSRVKPFGTPRTNASSERSIPSASANHVRYVVSFSAPLSRPATSFHRDSAVSSIGRSTPPAPLLSTLGEAEHSSVIPVRQRVETGDDYHGICRDFYKSTRLSTPVDGTCRFDAFPAPSRAYACGQSCATRAQVHWPPDAQPGDFFSLSTS